jgi:ABC-type Fe3+/spermidine/putrescine transport system ATPase subunit
MSVIRITGLQKLYGDVVAVTNVDLEVGQGEVLGLLGPSGCGKTTTLRCLAGLEIPTAGTIELAGRVVDSPTARVVPEKRGVGMVFQSYALWPHMTVAKNVEFPLGYCNGVAKKDRGARVTEALEAVGLDGYGDRYPGELSGGQQQRVAVARAIAPEPAVLLFDEPLSNLDAKLRNHVRIELKVLLRRLDATAVYVTHDQREAMSLCDRIAVMHGGVVRQIGTPEEIYEHPADIFVSDFVGDTNVLPFERLRDRGNSADQRDAISLAGQTFRVEQGQLPGGELATAHAAIRPEDITLQRSPVECAGGWEGTVVERLYLGAFVQYLVAIRGADVQLTVDARGPSFDVGDSCLAVPNLEKLVFIPGPATAEDAASRPAAGAPPAGTKNPPVDARAAMSR